MKLAMATMLALLAMSIPAAGASAARVPPGNSAATQYSETVPGAGGEEGTREPGTGKSAAGGDGRGAPSAVPAGTAAELEGLGPEGEAALRLAETDSSTGHHRDGTSGRGGGKRPDRDEGGTAPTGAGSSGGGGGTGLSGAAGDGTSGVGEVLGGAFGTSGGGLGLLQPLILATVVAAAGVYVVRRRRDRGAA
jgi:hypothetical protein